VAVNQARLGEVEWICAWIQVLQLKRDRASFDFLAIPSLNKALVLELARCEFIVRKENVLALGNSSTGKTHIALAPWDWRLVRKAFGSGSPLRHRWRTS
jgi:hypothetical protein